MKANTHHRTYDNETLLKDAGAVSASAAATVGGSAKVIDLNGGSAGIGPTAGMHAGAAVNKSMKVVADVSAFTNTNGSARVLGQVSSTSDFSSDIVNVGSFELAGGTAKVGGSDVDSTAGRYELGISNWRDGEQRRYFRLYTLITGTASINMVARLVPA